MWRRHHTNCSEIEIVEYVAACLPYKCTAILLLTFVYHIRNEISPRVTQLTGTCHRTRKLGLFVYFHGFPVAKWPYEDTWNLFERTTNYQKAMKSRTSLSGPIGMKRSRDYNVHGPRSLPEHRSPHLSNLAYSQGRAQTCHEYITRLRHLTSFPQQLQKVPKLSVNITAYRDGTWHGLNVTFFHENRANIIAEELHISFRQMLAHPELG